MFCSEFDSAESVSSAPDSSAPDSSVSGLTESDPIPSNPIELDPIEPDAIEPDPIESHPAEPDPARKMRSAEAPSLDMAALIDACDAAIISKSLDNIILSWNRAAETMYGYAAHEAIGKSILMLFPPDRKHEAELIIANVRQGAQIEHMETVRVTRDGRSIHVDLIVSPVRDEAGRITGALTMARDITAAKRVEAELNLLRQYSAERLVVLETANRVALDILASRTGVEALRHIAEAARTLSRARYAALGVAKLHGEGLMEFVTTGLTPEQEAHIGARPQGQGVLGVLLKRTAPLRIDALAACPEAVGFPPNHPPMKSFLGMPIRRGDTVLGSLYLTDKEGGAAFTEEDETAVEALGAHAAVAIYNLHLLARQRALVSGLIAAQEEERRAVAYDLHDGLTQFVMASHAHLESFRRAQDLGKVERATRELEQGLRYLQDAVVESRRLVNGLRSLALDDLGLAGALEQLLMEEKARAGWQDADFLHNISGKRYLKALETTIYRVAQEALTNARKHAATDRVRLMVLSECDEEGDYPRLTLEVRDWGKGFVPEAHAGDYGHFGLHSMVERIGLVGGIPQLHSAPGEGTVICGTFPALEAQPEAEESVGG